MIEPGSAAAGAADGEDLRAARRALAISGLGFIASAGGFGIVYGLAAREAGVSPIEALAMSVLVLSGAAQFAAVGLIAQGAPWPSIIVLTALLNARHLLYSAALAPWLADRPRLQRAAMAHVLTDETFGLAIAHFRRLGRADARGYWIAAAFVCLPWPLATLVGVLGGQVIPDPTRLGLDVVFPAAMAGLAVGLVTGRREIVAAVVGGCIAVIVGIAAGGAAVGVVAGGLLGPLVGLAIPERCAADTP
ncbi:MAG TPA: AzlC family ABC transporter permease [Candidatus Limnocylindria bacterium]|nr:AzlC family ABC transporter permease [Candidatus Limnocylindria bacterium]